MDHHHHRRRCRVKIDRLATGKQMTMIQKRPSLVSQQRMNNPGRIPLKVKASLVKQKLSLYHRGPMIETFLAEGKL